MKFLDQRRLQCRMTTMSFGDNKEGDRFATFTMQTEIQSKDKNLTQGISEEISAMERNLSISSAKIDESIPSQNIAFFSTTEQKRATETFTGIEIESIKVVRPRRGWPDANSKTIPKVLLQFAFTLPFEYVTPAWAWRAYRATFFVELGECQQELPMDEKKKKPEPKEGDDGEE